MMEKQRPHPKSIDLLTEYPTEEWQILAIKHAAKRNLYRWFTGAILFIGLIILLTLYTLSVFTTDNIHKQVFADGIMSGIMTIAAFLLIIVVSYFAAAEAIMQLKLNYTALRNPKNVHCRTATITKRQCRTSRDHAGSDTRAVNTFVAARLNEDDTIFADCSINTYESIVPGQSVGFFFSINDETVQVHIIENAKIIDQKRKRGK